MDDNCVVAGGVDIIMSVNTAECVKHFACTCSTHITIAIDGYKAHSHADLHVHHTSIIMN